MKYTCAILLFFLANTSIAQSYFYNTQHFGLQSTLLGGAVTAGSADISMAYYNPAALRYAEGKGFDVALFMPTLSINNYGDFFNTGEDLKSTDLSLNPSLITYKTSINNADIVFSILQRDIWDNKISYNKIKSTAFFDKSESFRYDYKGDEKWFGIASHHILGDGISVGLSHFWSIRSTNYRYHLTSETIATNANQFSFFDQNLNLDYASNFSFVTKLGFSFDRPKDRIGIVVTSPYYLSTQNSAKYQRTTSTLEDGNFELENIADFNLHPELKNGWQLDLGYAKILRDSSELWINASLHSGVDRHAIVEVNQVQQDPISLNRAINRIANVSIGHARFLSPNVQLIGSVRTNFNAYDHEAESDLSENIIVLEEDRIQFALGCKVRHNSSSFVIGLDYGAALNHSADQFESFPNIQRFDAGQAEFGHQSITVLLTYQFFIDTVGDNISKMLEKNRRSQNQ